MRSSVSVNLGYKMQVKMFDLMERCISHKSNVIHFLSLSSHPRSSRRNSGACFPVCCFSHLCSHREGPQQAGAPWRWTLPLLLPWLGVLCCANPASVHQHFLLKLPGVSWPLHLSWGPRVHGVAFLFSFPSRDLEHFKDISLLMTYIPTGAIWRDNWSLEGPV